MAKGKAALSMGYERSAADRKADKAGAKYEGSKADRKADAKGMKARKGK